MSTKNQDKQETIADIVAEMRNWWPHDPLKYPYPEEADNKDLSFFADRIEAAAKREKAQLGNAAAMRDALLKLDKWLYIGADGRVHGLHGKTGEIERNIKAALSASPRNCDRFSTWEEANKAFENENAHRIGFMNLYTDVIKWLFVHAKSETKGE